MAPLPRHVAGVGVLWTYERFFQNATFRSQESAARYEHKDLKRYEKDVRRTGHDHGMPSMPEEWSVAASRLHHIPPHSTPPRRYRCAEVAADDQVGDDVAMDADVGFDRAYWRHGHGR